MVFIFMRLGAFYLAVTTLLTLVGQIFVEMLK